MDAYTGEMARLAENIRLMGWDQSEDYLAELKQAAESFRSFPDALASFLAERGFDGDLTDTDAQAKFIRRCCKERGITDLRVSDLFKGEGPCEHKTAMKLCFAFSLSVDETNDFFRRVILSRGFDCHTMEDAVYYYAIKRGLSYADVKSLLDRLPKTSMRDTKPDMQSFYTDAITVELNRCENEEDLLRFLTANQEQFVYNNATITRNALQLLREIDGENGLLAQERDVQDWPKWSKISDTDVIQQICFGEELPSLLAQTKERSLKPLFDGTPYLHKVAYDCFPDRQLLTKLRQGKHMSYDSFRKGLILLFFYRFWVKWFLKVRYNLPDSDQAKGRGRFLYELNDRLTECGFQELYPGNPYDWMFLLASSHDFPLDTFRHLMRELSLTRE